MKLENSKVLKAWKQSQSALCDNGFNLFGSII